MHEKIKDYLLTSIKNDRVSHAYIFEGAKGIGKEELASFFVSALFCQDPINGRACGTCPSCVKLMTGNHPDYKLITKEADKKSIPIKEIRTLCTDIYIKPFLSKRKVYFIPEADLCEAPAQNALLKVFEEPPQGAVIILATQSADALLPTIRSRAVRIALTPCSEEEITDYVKTKYPEKSGAAEFIASFSEGLPGKAKSLCEDEEFLAFRNEEIRTLTALTGGAFSAFSAADFFVKNKEREKESFDILLTFLRDAALFPAGRAINIDFYDEIEAFSARFTQKCRARALFDATKKKAEAAKYAGYSLWITELLITIWEDLHDKGSRSQV